MRIIYSRYEEWWKLRMLGNHMTQRDYRPSFWIKKCQEAFYKNLRINKLRDNIFSLLQGDQVKGLMQKRLSFLVWVKFVKILMEILKYCKTFIIQMKPLIIQLMIKKIKNRQNFMMMKHTLKEYNFKLNQIKIKKFNLINNKNS